MSWFSRWFPSPTKRRALDEDIQESHGKKARVLFNTASTGDKEETFEIFTSGQISAIATLTTSSLVPRPLTLVTAVNKSGELTLATSTYCTVVSENPTYICVGLSKDAFPDDSVSPPADTIERAKELTISVVSDWIAEAATASPGTYSLPAKTTEADLKTGLTTSESYKVQAPRISEAGVVLECKLRHRYHIQDSEGQVTSTVVIAEVVCAGVKRGMLTEDATGKQTVDLEKLRPVAALGDGLYAQLSGRYRLPGLGAAAGPTTPPEEPQKFVEEEVAEAVAAAVADAVEAEGTGTAVKAVAVTLGSEDADDTTEIPVTVVQAD